MARKLSSHEAQVFNPSGNPAHAILEIDDEAFLRSLIDRQNEPLDLTMDPGLWLSGFIPEPHES